MSRYDLLVESYRTERLKRLSVWSQVPDTRTIRPEPPTICSMVKPMAE